MTTVIVPEISPALIVDAIGEWQRKMSISEMAAGSREKMRRDGGIGHFA